MRDYIDELNQYNVRKTHLKIGWQDSLGWISEHVHSFPSASRWQMQCDQLPPAPAVGCSPPCGTMDQNRPFSSEVMLARDFSHSSRKSHAHTVKRRHETGLMLTQNQLRMLIFFSIKFERNVSYFVYENPLCQPSSQDEDVSHNPGRMGANWLQPRKTKYIQVGKDSTSGVKHCYNSSVYSWTSKWLSHRRYCFYWV